MGKGNEQTWRRSFEGDLWYMELRRAVLDEGFEIKLNNILFHVEKTDKGKISGYYEFTFYNHNNMLGSVDKFEEKIRQNELKSLQRLFIMMGKTLEVEFMDIERLNAPPDAELSSCGRLGISFRKLGESVQFSNNDVNQMRFVNEKFQMIENNSSIIKILDFLVDSSDNDGVNFFNKWVALNCIYKFSIKKSNKNLSAKEYLDKFSEEFSKCDEFTSLLSDNKSNIITLHKKSKQYNIYYKNFSLKLENAINYNNIIDGQQVWKCVFDIMRNMRNKYFHQGDMNEDFKFVSKLITYVIGAVLKQKIKDGTIHVCLQNILQDDKNIRCDDVSV